MCLLQRSYLGCTSLPETDRFRLTVLNPVTEMRDCLGEDLAHGTFLLCAMWKAVWRGWFPWTRRQAVLSWRLLRYVRSKMWSVQSRNHGKLHFCFERPMASRLLRLQGKPFHTSTYIILFAGFFENIRHFKYSSCSDQNTYLKLSLCSKKKTVSRKYIYRYKFKKKAQKKTLFLFR